MARSNIYLYRRTESCWADASPTSGVSDRLGANVVKVAPLIRALSGASRGDVWVWPFCDLACPRGVWGPRVVPPPKLTIVEAFPKALLSALGLPCDKYKAARKSDDKLGAHAERLKIAHGLVNQNYDVFPRGGARLQLALLSPACEKLVLDAARDDGGDEIDAVACLLTAYIADSCHHRMNLCEVPDWVRYDSEVREEGWIAVPRTALAMGLFQEDRREGARCHPG